jgi:hypothetical protein
MKVIAIENGRTTWLFPVEEFVPIGGADGQNITAEIAERYSFTHPPAKPTREEIDKSGLKFAGGKLDFDGLTNVGEFVIYNDGMAVSASTTEGAEAFLNDVYRFLISEFSFRELTSSVRKIDLSAVVVEFDPSLSGALKAHDALAQIIGDHLNRPEGTQYPVVMTRMDFVLNKDPEFRPANLPRFTIEKRANTPFAQHRYYSTAPISTKSHLNVLEAFEHALLT